MSSSQFLRVPKSSHELPSAHPFDAAAASYDDAFSGTTLGRWLREAVQTHLAAAFDPGDHVLELGCGTGEDALWLASRGILVTATDASEPMLEIARHKAGAAGAADRIDFAQLDIVTLASKATSESLDAALPPSTFHLPPSTFSGAFSNFGPLNCLAERRGVAEALARWVQPGGQVVLVVMGPVCPWEIGWHLLHGRPEQAFRRFRPGVDAHVGSGETVRVWYPSPRTLAREFAPHFAVRQVAGIGSLLPPSYLGHLVDRRPAVWRKLAGADRRLAGRWPWNWLNDHYLMQLERRGDGETASSSPGVSRGATVP